MFFLALICLGNPPSQPHPFWAPLEPTRSWDRCLPQPLVFQSSWSRPAGHCSSRHFGQQSFCMIVDKSLHLSHTKSSVLHTWSLSAPGALGWFCSICPGMIIMTGLLLQGLASSRASCKRACTVPVACCKIASCGSASCKCTPWCSLTFQEH